MGGGIIASTEPAPLEVANRACHMVAACNFLYKALTFLAFLDVGGVLPILYLLPESSLAAGSGMGLSIAFVADFCCTFRTFAGLFIRICAYNN